MDDKKLYLIIVRHSVCKECGHALKDERWDVERIDRWRAHLMIVNGTEGFGNITSGYRFKSVDEAKEWGEYVAKELGRPITETEVKDE